jgi:hypothetical protein
MFVGLLRPRLHQDALDTPQPNPPNSQLDERLFFTPAVLPRFMSFVRRYNADHHALVQRIYNVAAGASGGGAPPARRPRECSEATACFLVADPRHVAQGAYFITPDGLSDLGESVDVLVLALLAVAAHFPVNRRVFQRARGDGMAVTGAILSAGIGSVLMEMAAVRQQAVAVLVADAIGAVFPPNAGEHPHAEWDHFYGLFRPFVARLVDTEDPNVEEEQRGFGMHISIHSAESNTAFSSHDAASHFQRADLHQLLPQLHAGGRGFRDARVAVNFGRGAYAGRVWLENDHPSARGQTLPGRRVTNQGDAVLATGNPDAAALQALPPSLQRLVHDQRAEEVAVVVADSLWTYEELADRLAHHMANNRDRLLSALHNAQPAFPLHHLHILLTEIASRSSRLELTFNHLLRLVTVPLLADALMGGAQARAVVVHHPEALPSPRWTLTNAVSRLLEVGWVTQAVAESAAGGNEGHFRRVVYQLARLVTSVFGGQLGLVGVALSALRARRRTAEQLREIFPPSLCRAIVRWSRARGEEHRTLSDDQLLVTGANALGDMNAAAVADTSPELAAELRAYAASSSGGLGSIGVALRSLARTNGDADELRSAGVSTALQDRIGNWMQMRGATGDGGAGLSAAEARRQGVIELGGMRASDVVAAAPDLALELGGYGSTILGQLGNLGVGLHLLEQTGGDVGRLHAAAISAETQENIARWWQGRDPDLFGAGGSGMDLTDEQALTLGVRALGSMQASAVAAEAPELAVELDLIGRGVVGSATSASSTMRGFDRATKEALGPALRAPPASEAEAASVSAAVSVARVQVQPNVDPRRREQVVQQQQQAQAATMQTQADHRQRELQLEEERDRVFARAPIGAGAAARAVPVGAPRGPPGAVPPRGGRGVFRGGRGLFGPSAGRGRQPQPPPRSEQQQDQQDQQHQQQTNKEKKKES